MKRNHKDKVQRNDNKEAQEPAHNHAAPGWVGKTRKARGDRSLYKRTVKTFARGMTREERRIAKLECNAARYDGRDVDTRPVHILARANQQT